MGAPEKTLRVTPDGRHIRRLRQAAGRSPTEFAKATGVDRTVLYRIEQGSRGASRETLQKIADELGCQLTDLLA